MYKRFHSYIWFFVLTVTICGFFVRLFFPTQKLIVTPDFGRSDVWHFSFPTKFLLSEALHESRLPVWSPYVGNGFPFQAEGQIGTFYLPNIFFFSITDPITAYNLALVFAFLALGWGMWWFIKLHNGNDQSAAYAGITIALSGLAIAQIPHITLLQGFCLIPCILAVGHLITTRRTLPRAALLAMLLSQQVLSGFPQAIFIGELFLIGYVVVKCWRQTSFIPSLGTIFLSTILALGISAIQLIPSYEFLRVSTSPRGFTPDIASYFSFPLSHLQTFFRPFALGNPQFGTYPPFYEAGGSIFWENIAYLGILPPIILLGCIGFWMYRRFQISSLSHRQSRSTIAFTIAILLSILLMTGHHSPFYIVYSFWPFYLFRVPSRFLWITLISIVALTSFAVDNFSKKKRTYLSITVVLMIFQIYSVYTTWWTYHPYVAASSWITPPPITAFLNTNDLIYSIGAEATHNTTFLNTGWTTMDPYYNLRNSLAPSSTMLFHTKTAGVYAGRFLNRPAVIQTAINSFLPIDDKHASMSAAAHKLIAIQGVTALLSTVPVHAIDVPKQTLTTSTGTYDLYRLPQPVPRAYIAHDIHYANTAESAIKDILSDSFILNTSVLLESKKEIVSTSLQNKNVDVTVKDESPTMTSITVTNNPFPGVLVLTDTYYPGWKATVNGEPTELFPANIQQRGIVIPQGDSNVSIFYDFAIYKKGAMITLLSIGILLSIIVFPVFSWKLRK